MLLIVFYVINPCYGQITLKIEEDKQSGCLIKHKPKEGNTLLLFKTSLELNFESSWVIVDTIREKNIFILEVEAVSQSISLYYENIPTILNFGMQQGTVNSFPTLNLGEVKCFNVDIKPELEYADITNNELKRGMFKTPIGPNASDAVVVIRLFPNDLELTISETNNLISKQEKSGNTYNVFLKMPESKKFSNYELQFKSEGTDDISVSVPKLEPKGFKFFRIKKPLVEVNAAKIEPEKPPTQINEPVKEVAVIPPVPEIDYQKNIIGFWAGSLGDDKTYLEFTSFDANRKTLTGKLYANGVFMNFKGAIRFKTENDYQTSLSIIKDELVNYGATIDLRYNSGVLNGLWIDDLGEVKDFSAVRANTIISDNTSEVRQKVMALNKLAAGTWHALTSNAYFDNLTLDKANIQQFSNINFLKTGQPIITTRGKLFSKSGMVSMVVSNVQFPGISSSCSVTLVFNEQEASASIISDDGSVFENVKLRRPSAQPNKIADVNSNVIYYVSKDKAFFYNKPNFANRTNRYIVKGQLPVVHALAASSDFLMAEYTYQGITTKGNLLKSDLTRFNLNYLLNTSWSGIFGKNQLKIVMESIYWDQNNVLVVKGYNVLQDKKRDLEGKIVLIDENQIQINLAEPGTEEWDGIFKLTFSYNNDVSGVWLSNNGKLRRDFQLQKIFKN